MADTEEEDEDYQDGYRQHPLIGGPDMVALNMEDEVLFGAHLESLLLETSIHPRSVNIPVANPPVASPDAISANRGHVGRRRGRKARPAPDPDHQYECQVCGGYFASRYGRDRHLASIHRSSDAELPYDCEICHIYKTDRLENLRTHMKSCRQNQNANIVFRN